MNKPTIKIYPTKNVVLKTDIDSGQTGPRGPIGLTPVLTVANTFTGDPESFANVSIDFPADNPQFPELTFTIPRGTPFVIAAEYQSVDDLLSNTNPEPVGYEPNLFDLAIVVADVEDPENANLYIFDDNDRPGKNGWTFVSDLSGATGPMRGIRWRPGSGGSTTSILEWQKNDGTWEETSARDLALQFDFDVINDELILTIENPDNITDTIHLTATAEFGDGTNATVTSARFNNNNATFTSWQELGVYASWNNTELTLTNPDNETVAQELALDFNWDGTTLQIKNPSEATYAEANEQKLSPDIEFRTDTNGVEISVVEPTDESNFIKISPDIEFDGTKIAVTEPTVTAVTADFVELAVYGEFGGTGITDTTLTVVNPDGEEFIQELGVYGEFGGTGLTDTTLTLTNPDTTDVVQELGVYASWNNTELVLTNPDSTTVEQELALDFNWDGTTLQIKNPTDENYITANEQKLSPDIAFRNVGDGLELSIVEPGAAEIYNKVSPDIEFDGTKIAITEPDTAAIAEDFVELALYGEFGGGSFTDTTLTVTNPDDEQISQELGVYADFSSNTSDTIIVFTNPNMTTVEQELGVYGEFGGTGLTDTTLTLTNPDDLQISQELGVYGEFGGTGKTDTTLVLTNPDGQNIDQELGVYADFNSSNSDTTIVFTNPDMTTVEQELGVYASYQDITKLVLTNPDGDLPEVELGLIAEFGADTEDNITELKITNPQGGSIKQELGVYGEFGAEYVAGTTPSEITGEPDIEIIEFSETILKLTNPDGDTVQQELGVYADFGGTITVVVPGETTGDSDQEIEQELSPTTLVLTNPDMTTITKELGLSATFQGTALVVTNPDNTSVAQELSLQFQWTNTTLGVRTPLQAQFTTRKLSPDITFDTSDGVSVSIVEPTTTANFIKISPDIEFQNIGNGLELSIVEPGETTTYNKISPDISWDGSKLAIVEPDTSPDSGDYVELGVYGSFGGTGITDTTLVLENPTGISIEQELGVYASWTDTELKLTNPDSTEITQELALQFDWDGPLLGVKNPTEATFTYEKLSPDITFDTSDGVEISVVEPGDSEVFVKISPDITFDTDDGVFVSIVEPGATEDLIKISPDIYFQDTSIAIMEPGVIPGSGDYIDLKGETGDASVPGSPLFKIRDDLDDAGDGFEVTVADELKFTGGTQIFVERTNGTFNFNITEVDGGDF